MQQQEVWEAELEGSAGRPSFRGSRGPGNQPSGEELLMHATEQERQETEAKLEEKRRQEQLRTGTLVVQLLAACTVFNIVMLLIPLFGTSWTKRKMHGGFGVEAMALQADIFALQVVLRCVRENPLEELVCARFRHIDGKHTLYDAQAKACSLSAHACAHVGSLYNATLPVVCTFFIALVLLVVGLATLVFYWRSAQQAKVRLTSMACFLSAPPLVALGIACWTFMVPKLGEFPHAWTQGMGVLGDTYGEGSPESLGSKLAEFGWCWYWACTSVLLIVAQDCLCLFRFVPHPNEAAVTKTGEEEAAARMQQMEECRGPDEGEEGQPLNGIRRASQSTGQEGQPLLGSRRESQQQGYYGASGQG